MIHDIKNKELNLHLNIPRKLSCIERLFKPPKISKMSLYLWVVNQWNSNTKNWYALS